MHQRKADRHLAGRPLLSLVALLVRRDRNGADGANVTVDAKLHIPRSGLRPVVGQRYEDFDLLGLLVRSPGLHRRDRDIVGRLADAMKDQFIRRDGNRVEIVDAPIAEQNQSGKPLVAARPIVEPRRLGERPGDRDGLAKLRRPITGLDGVNGRQEPPFIRGEIAHHPGMTVERNDHRMVGAVRQSHRRAVPQ